MPDPFNKTKMSGDVHPPEIESDLPLEEGSADAAGTSGTGIDRGTAAERGDQARPGRGVKRAGMLKDNEHQLETEQRRSPRASER